MKVKGKVCFCPASLKWIFTHLQKSAKSKFRKMVQGQVVPALVNLRKRKRKSKRRFSAKQLAAQRLFAKRARAGTLRRGRKRRGTNSRR